MEVAYKQKIRHVADIFDMIVGTSTGGLITFCLLAGNENEDGTRDRMRSEEVIEFYKK